MAELKPLEAIMRIDFTASDGSRIVAHAERVQELVRCKDCKWYEINELKRDGTEDRRFKPSVCMLAGQRRGPMHYCADGERRLE